MLTALKGYQFILFAITAAGVVPCGGPKKYSHTSSIVHIIFSFWSIGISEGSLRNQKVLVGLGYNLNVMRQSACLVFNPIMVDNYAAFFNCTPVGRASDSMMAPT